MNGKRARIFSEILIFAALAALSAVSLYPLQKIMLGTVRSLQSALLLYAENALNKKISYQSMSPSIFGSLDIRHIALYDPEDRAEEEPLLTIERLRLNYSLLSLLRGDAMHSFSSIHIDKPVFYLDTGRKIKSLFPQSEGGGKEGSAEDGRDEVKTHDEDGAYLIEKIRKFAQTIPDNFNASIHQGSAVLALGETTLALSSFEGSLLLRHENLILKTNWNAKLTLGGTEAAPGTVITVPGRAEGIFNSVLTRGDINLLIPELSTEYVTLRKTRFAAVWTENEFKVHTVGGTLPYDFSFVTHYSGGEYSARFNAVSFSPASILTLNGPFARYNHYLLASLDGNASLSHTLDLGTSYKLHFYALAAGRGRVPFFELSVEGNEEQAVFHKLNIFMDRGRLSWQGTLDFSPFAPTGIIRLDSFYATKSANPATSMPVSGSLIISGREDRIGAVSDNLALGSMVFQNVALAALRKDTGWNITLKVQTTQSEAQPPDVLISPSAVFPEDDPAPVVDDSPAQTASGLLWASADIKNDTGALVLDVSLAEFPLIAILRGAGVITELPLENTFLTSNAEKIVVSTEARLTQDGESFSYTVPHLSAQYRGADEINLKASLQGNEHSFELLESSIAYKKENVSISARADYPQDAQLSFRARAVYEQNMFIVQGAFAQKNIFELSTNFGLAAKINIGGAAGTTGSVSADSLPLPFVASGAYLVLRSTFRVNTLQNWYINLISGEIFTRNEKTSDARRTQMRFAGSVDQDRVQLTRLDFEGSEEALRGSAYYIFKDYDADNDNTGDSTPNLRVELLGEGNHEQFIAIGRYHDSALDIRIDVQALKVYRFIAPQTNMTLSGRFDISAERSGAFFSAFSLDSVSGRLGNWPFNFSSTGSLNPTYLDIGETIIHLGEITLFVPYININRETSSIAAQAHLSGTSSSIDTAAAITLAMNFASISSWADTAAALRELSGTINVSEARLVKKVSSEKETKRRKDNTPELSAEFSIGFEKHEGIFTIAGGPDEMLNAEIDTGAGNFFANIAVPSPVSGIFIGRVENGLIDLEASQLFIDLEMLGRFVPESSPVICTDGIVFGDLTIKGDIANPKFMGKAQGYGVKIKVPQYITEEVGPATITMRFTGEDLLFDPILTPVGSGESYITGAFHFDRWVPRNFELAIAAQEDRPLPYKLHVSPITSTGLVSGLLELSLDEDTLSLTGDMLASDSIIGLDAESAASRDEKRLAIKTDIKIRAGKRVEFQWPNESMTVLRANIGAGGILTLQSDSFADTFALDGSIALRSGELFYFQRSFYIRSGVLVFNRSNENYIPHLTARAETQDRNQDGPVRISIIIDDQPLSSFVPRFISEPALSQVEILSLLGKNFYDTDEDENIPQVIVAATDAFTQFYFVRRFERGIRDFFGIDMFSARTQALQNLIFESLRTPQNTAASPDSETASTINNPTDTTTTTTTTTAASPRIGAYLDNSTIFAGKYIGSDMFVQAMVSARYDKNKVDMGGLSFEVDVGIELTNPLFNIRWDITPRHNESLWVPDARISIQKSWQAP